jgi:hypothetical protein
MFASCHMERSLMVSTAKLAAAACSCAVAHYINNTAVLHSALHIPV